MTTTQHADELLQGFLDEGVHALRDLPEQLAAFRQSPADPAPIHAVFRAIHSIKGNAGFFGLATVKKFAHALENTLDEIRNDRLTLSESLQRAIVEGIDLLDEMLHRIQEGQETTDLAEREQAILLAVEGASRIGADDCDHDELLKAGVRRLISEMSASTLAEAQEWASRLRALLPAEDPATAVAAATSGSGSITRLLQVRYALAGQDITASVQSLLMPFVQGEQGVFERATAQAFIANARALASQYEGASFAAALMSASEHMSTILASPLDLDNNLLGIVWDAIAPQLAQLQQEETTTAAEVASATATPPETKAIATPAAPGKGRYIRVKEEHLEEFVGDVSRLFITCERLKDLHIRMAGEKLLPSLVDELKQINAAFYTQTNALQGSVVALRNVPAQALFGKFPRMARSLAGNLGKQLEVVLYGEEVGIDKSLVEDLDAPLTHMIRNVCDHAIETPDERRDCGKPETGKLTLRCELSRTHVLITIEDDGRGIDPVRLRRKAVEKNLLTQAQADALSEQEAIDLIFHPGFSTAEQITEVSGRGVGMDVVRTTLREHDGDVTVSSVLGTGTIFRLNIPIRQAVLVVDGLLVRQGDSRFVVPLENIREIVELTASDLKTVHGENIALVRGNPLAALSLAEVLQLPHTESDNHLWHGIVLQTKEGTLCLLTERVLGQRKVVISGLRDILPGVENIAGVAQLGGGKLALVLSAPDVIRAASREHRA